MTIASEINRINGNIANAYTALGEKGATLPQAQNSANLAATIAGVPAGGGDTVTAINYTGSAIAEGAKVWLNKKANVSASALSVSSNSSYNYILEPAGNYVYNFNRDSGYTIYKYDISTNKNTALSLKNPNAYSYVCNYDDYGNMFYENINFSTGTSVDMYCLADDYAINGADGRILYKVDKTNDLNKLHTWNISGGYNASSKIICTVVGNVLYAGWFRNSGLYKGIIDENSDTITLSYVSGTTHKNLLYSTADNKLALIANGSSSYMSWESVALYSLNADYTIGGMFTSANAELNNLFSLTSLNICFNRVSGILCISSTDNYGMFKYENGDFTTISLTLDNTTGVTDTGYMMSTTNDLSKVQCRNILYTLEQTADGTYKAVPYHYGMGSETLTGVATTSAENGASFEATTIVPNEET